MRKKEKRNKEIVIHRPNSNLSRSTIRRGKMTEIETEIGIEIEIKINEEIMIEIITVRGEVAIEIGIEEITTGKRERTGNREKKEMIGKNIEMRGMREITIETESLEEIETLETKMM
jgi:hypothetical protein